MPETEKSVTPLTAPPKKGKSVVATAWPVGKFRLSEDLVITSAGTELSAADAKKAFELAEASDVQLVTIKEEEVSE